MSKKINFLLFSIILSIAAFTYLSYHHYSLKTGLGDSSLCTLSSKINCDAAATSKFAEIKNIPIAILGAFFQFILMGFVLFYKLGWTEGSIYLRYTIRFQLLFSALTSVVMGLISLIIIKVACPFCVVTYLLSFASLYLGWNIINYDDDNFDFTEYFKDFKSHMIALISVPILSWAVAGMTLSHYGLDEVEKYLPEKLAIWNAGTQYNFDNNIGLSNKVENPKHTLIEFADFKCPHCRVASKNIELFLRGRTDVLFIYKPFPLDGNCNSSISQKGDGSRCLYASYALCAEKLNSKGADLTHWLFENQESFFSIDAKSLLPKMQEKFGIDAKAMSDCADSAETYDIISKSSQEGADAKVEGTPTIYLNGKKLPWGHMLEVLKRATN